MYNIFHLIFNNYLHYREHVDSLYDKESKRSPKEYLVVLLVLNIFVTSYETTLLFFARLYFMHGLNHHA
jgi:hypothetical protein